MTCCSRGKSMSLRAWRTVSQDAESRLGRGRPDNLVKPDHSQFFFEADDGAIFKAPHQWASLVTVLEGRGAAYPENVVRRKLSESIGTESRKRVVRAQVGYGQYYPRIWRGE